MVTPSTYFMEEKVPFHFLADELILMVFSYLNPVEVACSVAKVCSRWRKIARDPSLWGKFELVFNSEETEEFVQVLSFAPCLHSIVIDRLQHVNESIVTKMLHGCNFVNKLALYPNRTLETELQFKIIKHYKNHLMVLNMYIDNTLVQYHKQNGVTESSLFSIIASMPCLKQLIFRGHLNVALHEEEFELAHGCPALEALNICGLDLSFDGPKPIKLCPWALFVMKFLPNKLNQLRSLRLPTCPGACNVSDPLSNLFHSSSHLEHLTVCEMYLPVTKNLHHLKSLHIVGVKCQYICPPFEHTDYLSWMLTAPTYPKLKELILEGIIEDDVDLIPKLISTCNTLESLTVKGGHLKRKSVSALIMGLPTLKRLSLHRCDLNIQQLDLISVHLPQLRLLDLRNNVLSRGILPHLHFVIRMEMPNLEFQTDCKFSLALDSESDSESDSE